MSAWGEFLSFSVPGGTERTAAKGGVGAESILLSCSFKYIGTLIFAFAVTGTGALAIVPLPTKKKENSRKYCITSYFDL